MAIGSPLTVVASAARTVTGNSAALAVAPALGQLVLGVNVTAASGTTPSMTLSVEWSHDGGATWSQADPADTFTAITAAAVKVKSFAVKSDVYRIVWTITGTTPSFTFAMTQYGTPL